MTPEGLKGIIEALILSSNDPLTIGQLQGVFEEQEQPTQEEVLDAIEALQTDYHSRAFELVSLASGYRIRTKKEYGSWISRLNSEKPVKYSRALLETLSLIAYKQPVTRGDIEEIRGVAVSSYIMKTLLEREWIRIAGHRDVPGKPAVYTTTKQFLDYFNLKSLQDLPTLQAIADLDKLEQLVENHDQQIELALTNST
ncbi:MAG: SMC-Scp complex subunit ScpB, partial [Legionellales bacterium]